MLLLGYATMWINNRLKQYTTTTTLSEENTCSDPHKKRREKILVVIIFTREKIKLLLGTQVRATKVHCPYIGRGFFSHN